MIAILDFLDCGESRQEDDPIESLSVNNLKSKIQNLKWTGIVALAVTFVVCGPVAQAQQQAKMLKIGWLSPGSAASTDRVELCQREFRKLGYVDGKNITFERRSADDQLDRLPGLAHELVRLKVDVLLTPGGNGALALKKATRTIPIVFFGAVSDPIDAGLVDSLSQPGGNITGFTTISAVLVGKRLELLKETVPKLSHLAVLWNPKSIGAAQSWKESQLAARELSLQLYSMEVSSADKFESAFKEAAKAGSTALAVTQDWLFTSNRKRIANLAAKNRLPAMYYRGDFVESGGLISYGADQDEPYRRAASMVDKILKGTKPGDIPVEQPTKFDLVINLKTAKQIGLTIPSSVLARADRVIK